MFDISVWLIILCYLKQLPGDWIIIFCYFYVCVLEKASMLTRVHEDFVKQNCVVFGLDDGRLRKFWWWQDPLTNGRRPRGRKREVGQKETSARERERVRERRSGRQTHLLPPHVTQINRGEHLFSTSQADHRTLFFIDTYERFEPNSVKFTTFPTLLFPWTTNWRVSW